MPSNDTRFARVSSRLSRFAEDRGGNVVILTSIALVPVLMGIATAVNYGSGVMRKQQLQNGLDSASMAAAYNIGLGKDAAYQLGIDAYVKQVPPGGELGTIAKTNFEAGVWNDDTRTFTPTAEGSAPPMLYLVGMKPVYYNAVRVTTKTGADAPYISNPFSGLTGGGSKIALGGSSIAYVPPTACLNISNIGDPYRFGKLPADSDYAGFRTYKDGFNFTLILSNNSAWYTCGYWNNTNFGETYYNAPSAGSYAVTNTGKISATWTDSGSRLTNTLVSELSWSPISVPDEFVAPYRNAACKFNNTVVKTTADIALEPGVYCGGIDIQQAGAKVTLNPGVYVMRNGNFTMRPALGTGQTRMYDPASGMPVGPNPATIKTNVQGDGVTILFEGANSVFNIFGGGLKLTAPTVGASPNLGGLVVYSYDDNPTYALHAFENTQVTFIGTFDTRNKKVWSAEVNLYSDCDIVCMNIGNLWMNNTLVKVQPGQFLSDPKTMTLNDRVRRPSYPMIRIAAPTSP